MGDFVPGSDFIPGSDVVPGVTDVLGIDTGIGDVLGFDSGTDFLPGGDSFGGIDPGVGGDAFGGIDPGSDYISGTDSYGGWDPGVPPGTDVSKIPGGSDPFGGIRLPHIPNIPGLFPGSTSGGGKGTGSGTGTGTGTGTSKGSDPYSSASGLTDSSVVPQVTPGSSAPINLTGGGVKAETFGSPVNFATGGTTDMGLSNENWLRDNPNPSLSHNASHGRTFAPISLINKPAGFENLVPPVKPELYAEGGEAEHTPEFYSEGGMKNTYVQGDGDGTSDSVPAMLANGEFVIPADVVSSLGNGSNDSGSKVLDKFLHTIRQHKQQHAPNKLPPDSKGVLSYLSEANHKVKK